MNVPKWNTYYPSLEFGATKKQKVFYYELEKALNENRFLAIEGNITYIFVYLYKVIEEFVEKREIKILIEKFERVKNLYGDDEKISEYLVFWLIDAYLYKDDFENAWILQKKCERIKIEDIIYVRGNCKETSIDSAVLHKILGSNTGLTKFGRENLDEVLQLVDIFLHDFYIDKGYNYAEYFLKKYDYGNISEKDFFELKNYYINERDYLKWKVQYIETQKSNKPYPKKFHHGLFAGAPLEQLPFFERTEIPSLVSVALSNEFKRIFREAEDTVREEKGLPKVGEGWISEANLYYEISKYFGNERIIHHGRPHWLKRQHLDIYFPDKNIAIEYQGKQHQEPIDFFGGEEAFLKQQEMDLKKKNLCEINNCELIYVYEDYSFEELLKNLKKLL